MEIHPQRILVIKLSSLGDIIHALPAVFDLRQCFPTAHMTWLVKTRWAPILEGNPDIDTIMDVEFSFQNWMSLIQRLRKGSFDLVVDLQGLFRSALLGAITGAPHRIGFARAREGAPWLYTDHVHLQGRSKTPWRLLDQHAVDRNRALSRFLGAKSVTPVFHFPQFSEDSEKLQEICRLASLTGQEELVALAPWSRSELKSWPIDRFVNLARELCGWTNIRVVLLGGESDKTPAKDFENLESQGLINLVGRVSLRQLPLLLRQVKLLIGNDSAPIHLAAGVGTSVCAIFGATHPRATGPYPLEEHTILRTELPCSPCGKRACQNPKYLECLQTIQVETVLQEVARVIGNPEKGSVSVG